MAAAAQDEITAPLIAELSHARGITDRLFARIPPPLLYERAIAERHRPVFYIGHLEAFDVNLLDSCFRNDGEFQRRFAFGIDPLDGNLPADRADDWPSPDEMREGASAARARVDDALENAEAIRLHAAIEHRLMHAETLAYLFNRLPIEKPIRAVPEDARDVERAMVHVPAGLTTLGTDVGAEPFAWDNELHSRVVEVAAFEIDRCMVTCGEFLRFLEAGGYEDPRWWTEDDWAWRTSRNITHPASWQKRGSRWLHVSLFDLVPFQATWPAYVSHAEASAYARWAGKALPTEAQWQRAVYGDEAPAYPWGDAAPGPEHGHFDFPQWDPVAVDAHPAGASAVGALGLLGNGWEWTSTPFAPLPGFAPYPFYRGYSADFFDGRHFVLKGGSAHTAARLLRRSFRNWFQPHYPHVFAGFRCVKLS